MKVCRNIRLFFTREREYHISRGLYPEGHHHDLILLKIFIIQDLNLILVTSELEPISFLYIEKNEDDYDKIWTVCTMKIQR